MTRRTLHIAIDKVEARHVRHTARICLSIVIILLLAGLIGYELFSKVTESAVAADLLSRLGAP